MDRSFLSDDILVEASREFVCVRLTTYENEEEHEFMEELNTRGVQNTTFALLSPDTKEIFVQPSRSPQFQFRNPFQLAALMHEIAAKYTKQPSVESSGILPISADVRIGLNIAAADKLPLVVAVGDKKTEVSGLQEKLKAIAWKGKLIGRCVYASTADKKDLQNIRFDKKPKSGYFVVQPGEFGINGTVLASIDIGVSGRELEESIAKGIAKHKKHKSVDHRTHIENGAKAGVFWDTPVKVSDPMEANARSRTKQLIERNNK